MQPQTLEGRVESREQRVTILEQLPARVDALGAQISQLREAMHAEFSAVRTEMRAGDHEIMTHARVLHEDMKAALALIADGRPTKSTRRRPK
jgi:hypothetical protein